ncbi:WhiB family transcriptional regulator [Actinocrispum wychmicini]|uniref:Transcriptional regulator WhiB n=1 Tax=Actinocrispum wychmicini TaxID=1213861 RepID=A0A4R2JHY0_9PSEU|nr:WhiB family transcriptional regulator [Actinocrispum wychmicini]TCO59491.1 WhiB family redox-sensing transcriptional regulator [Actinocrispum wychmicini]
MAELTRLPNPVAEAWDWQIRGACRGQDSQYFFHPEHERGVARATREKRAKEICQTCPVLVQCREHALTVRELYGIWGAMGEGERREALNHRRQARRTRATS